jgi:uncharacterized coiled-coil DUF342 family protein
MDHIQDILQLRKQVRRLEDDASNLALFAPSADEIDAYDRLAMELHDLDTALYNAVFLRNDSRIEELIEGIRGTAEEAQQVRKQLGELTAVFTKAREVVRKANNLAGKAKKTLDEVGKLLTTLKQPV